MKYFIILKLKWENAPGEDVEKNSLIPYYPVGEGDG